MKRVQIAEMTSVGFQKAVAGCKSVIIPLGSVEELGRHGPLGADWFIAAAIAERVARKADCLVAPAIPYGDTAELDFWPGTVNIGTETLTALYLAVARAFIKHGAAEILFLNCHSLNLRSADAACRILHAEGCRVSIVDWWKVVAQAGDGILEAGAASRGHGGEMITSVVLALRPDTVDLSAAEHEQPKEELRFYGEHGLNTGSPFRAFGDFRRFCETGAWGDVRTASAQKGEALIERAVERIVSFIGDFREAGRVR